MAGGNIQRKNIDWEKPHLRTVYLVEGVWRDTGGAERFVRWCGPRSRAGGGFLAYATMGAPAFPFEVGNNTVAHVPAAWEPRLSGGSFDSTVGGLKQNIQALSQSTFSVALGDDDNAHADSHVDDLRDMAVSGHWHGQQARLILVDADEIECFEVVVDGTWDRNPTSVDHRGFRMTINAGEALPPTLVWGAQIPDTVDYFQVFYYDPSTFEQSPTTFGLNPDHAGRWLGEIFGGGTHARAQMDPTPIGTQKTWREIVPYGSTATSTFAWFSPRFDQMLYDLVMETEDGLVRMSTMPGGHPSNHMRVFNNNAPSRGPVGTCVAFDNVPDFDFIGSNHRIFARVAGGEILVRPPGYSDIGYSGNPLVADNLSHHGECVPQTTLPNPGNKSNAVNVFAQIVQDPHFLNAPSWLHPGALADLSARATIYNLPVEFRTAAVPRDITDEPIKYRDALESLMRSIPADLTFRLDPADGQRKFFAVARQQPGQEAFYKIRLADLADSSTPARVKMMDDPDGYYANDISFSTSEYYNPPITGLSEESANELVRTNHWQSNLVDILEQSSTRTGQVITGDEKLKYWRHENAAAFKRWAVTLDVPRSQAQKVIEAVHGYRSMRLSLGKVIQYLISGVYAGPGQVRGMKYNLDEQTVSIRSYHLPIEPTIVANSTTVRDKERAVTSKDTPHHDRREG